MGKSNKERKNETKTKNNAASIINETATPSESNTTYGNKESDCNQKSIGKTHAAAIFSEEISYSERRNRSPEVIEKAKTCSHRRKFKSSRKKFLEDYFRVKTYLMCKYGLEMNIEIIVDIISQSDFHPNEILEHYQELYESTKINYPEILKQMEKCVRLELEKYRLQQLSSTSSKSNEVSKAGGLKEAPCSANDPIMGSVCDIETTSLAHLVKEEENKIKTDGNGRSIDKVKKSACSAQNVSDFSQKSIGKIHTAAIFPEVSDSESKNRSTEDSEIAEIISYSEKSKLTREEFKKVLFVVENYIMYKCGLEMNFQIEISQSQADSNVLLEQYRNLYEFLKINSSKLVENMEERTRLKLEIYQLQQLSSSLSKLNQMPKAGGLKETSCTANVPVMTLVADNDVTIACAHLVKVEENKHRTDGNGTSIDNVQKSTFSVPKVSDCSQKSIDQTHAAAIFPEERSNSEGNRFTEDSEISETSSNSGESKLTREEFLGLLNAAGHYIMYKCRLEMNYEFNTRLVSQSQAYSNLVNKHCRYVYEVLKVEIPKIVEDLEEIIRLKIEKNQLQQLSRTLYKSNEEPKPEGLKETPCSAVDPMMSISDNNVTIPRVHLIKDEENKFKTDGNGSSIDKLQKSTCSTENLAKDEAVKNIDLSALYTQDINDIICNFDAKTITENIEKSRYSVHDSEMKIRNEIKDEPHEQTDFNLRTKTLATFLRAKTYKDIEKYQSPESLLKSAKEKHDLSFTQNEVMFEETDELEVINSPTEQADQTNDLIMKLQKVDITKEKKKDCDSFTYKFPEKANQDEKKEEKDNAAYVSNVSICDSYMTEKAETSKEAVEIMRNLENNVLIQFELGVGGDKHVFADSNYTLKEDQTLSFNYKDGVKVSFFGNHVTISTPNSEFDIFVRNSNPVSLTDETTQTDS